MPSILTRSNFCRLGIGESESQSVCLTPGFSDGLVIAGWIPSRN